MANDINKVILIGRLVRDPELKSTSGGTNFCKFTLASNRTIYKKDADNVDEVGFFDCVAWGKLSEIIAKYCTKGKRIAVDGSLRFSSWENSDGKKQSKVEINVDNFQFLDSKEAKGTPIKDVNNDIPMGAGNDDDIPF